MDRWAWAHLEPWLQGGRRLRGAVGMNANGGDRTREIGQIRKRGAARRGRIRTIGMSPR
jgi:hypothetical protein